MDIQYFVRKGLHTYAYVDPFFGAQAELKILIILLNDFHAEKKIVSIKSQFNAN